MGWGCLINLLESIGCVPMWGLADQVWELLAQDAAPIVTIAPLKKHPRYPVLYQMAMPTISGSTRFLGFGM